jgi:DnaJ-domain-containing protein 1
MVSAVQQLSYRALCDRMGDSSPFSTTMPFANRVIRDVGAQTRGSRSWSLGTPAYFAGSPRRSVSEILQGRVSDRVLTALENASDTDDAEFAQLVDHLVEENQLPHSLAIQVLQSRFHSDEFVDAFLKAFENSDLAGISNEKMYLVLQAYLFRKSDDEFLVKLYAMTMQTHPILTYIQLYQINKIAQYAATQRSVNIFVMKTLFSDRTPRIDDEMIGNLEWIFGMLMRDLFQAYGRPQNRHPQFHQPCQPQFDPPPRAETQDWASDPMAPTALRGWAFLKRHLPRGSAPEMGDPYSILGLHRGASMSEVKQAYERLALELHPDQTLGMSESDRAMVQEALQLVSNAYHEIQEAEARKSPPPAGSSDRPRKSAPRPPQADQPPRANTQAPSEPTESTEETTILAYLKGHLPPGASEPVIQDPYSLLGLPRGADSSAVRHAYKLLALKLHPDKTVGKSEAERKMAAEAFKLVSNAYHRIA